MAPPVTEGFAPFHVPGLEVPCKTWYKIHGTIPADTTPLIVLHGGPGFSHDYLIPVADLAEIYGIPVVFYDQLGNGHSTHLPDASSLPADATPETFWTPELFLDEMKNLLAHLRIDRYDLLGHSWGGMLAALHGIDRAPGLRRIVFADALADLDRWEASANELRARLPADVQVVLDRCEREGTTDSKEYEEATITFYNSWVCRMDPWPECFMKAMENYMSEPGVYNTMLGPNEFTITGTLKGWSVESELRHIGVPTLILNGRYDEAQDSVVAPFYEYIPDATWVSFRNSAHLPHCEERENWMHIVGRWLLA